ncbi:MAG: CPBP family intramembrane metalloprotease [Lachnospiraceae bacterium]|nr:CPBP family intramembrane metalloprotease [Lachnospiraceae bacterium]
MESSTEVANNKFKTVLFCIWVAAAMLLIQMGVGVIGGIVVSLLSVFKNMGGNAADQQAVMDLLSGKMVYIELAAVILALIIMAFWYYFGYVKKSKADGSYEQPLKKIADVRFFALMIITSIAVYSLAYLLNNFATFLLPEAGEKFADMMQLTFGGNDVVGFIAAGIIGPVCEELTLRGIVLKRSERSFGMVGCIILNALIFSCMHMNPIQGIYALPMGIVFTYVCYRYNSVVPGIILHILNNSISFLLSRFINTDNLSNLIWIVVFVLLALGAFLIARQMPEFKGNKEEEQVCQLSAE